MDWLTDFVSQFDGPAIATAFFSLCALVVSIFAIIRTRTPSPSWEFLRVSESKVPEDRPAYTDQFGDAVFHYVDAWSADFRQNGPGVAESVRSRVQLPDGKWTSEGSAPMYATERGAEMAVLLCAGKKVPGKYRVRLSYRQLPNTRKVRHWEAIVTLE
ncbi:hypothetical protein SRABI98_00966 [Microbacterium sp. Bi98]|nr:hypothetical protein SRABI98_00966 [Microbacterium sp. Bi98]